MKEYDDFFELREVEKGNLKPITYTNEVIEKLSGWDYFMQATTTVINEISNQSDLSIARQMAVEWYKSCIVLGKKYYRVEETTDQIYNNVAILINDVSTANFMGIRRTFITTFTNVAKYQKVGDTDELG